MDRFTIKKWGRCRTIFRDDEVEIVECEIRAGESSSIHRHMRKDNSFLVLAGELELATCADTPFPNKFKLVAEGPAGGAMLVPPEVWHQFKAVTDVRLLEVYRAVQGSGRIGAGEADIERK